MYCTLLVQQSSLHLVEEERVLITFVRRRNAGGAAEPLAPLHLSDTSEYTPSILEDVKMPKSVSNPRLSAHCEYLCHHPDIIAHPSPRI